MSSNFILYFAVSLCKFQVVLTMSQPPIDYLTLLGIQPLPTLLNLLNEFLTKEVNEFWMS